MSQGPLLDFKLLVTGALSFTVALAWNSAVESSIRGLYPTDRSRSAHANFVYAIAVTVLVVVAVVLINHANRAAEKWRRQPPSGVRGGARAKALASQVNILWPRPQY